MFFLLIFLFLSLSLLVPPVALEASASRFRRPAALGAVLSRPDPNSNSGGNRGSSPGGPADPGSPTGPISPFVNKYK